jgi:hypothetical protein
VGPANPVVAAAKVVYARKETIVDFGAAPETPTGDDWFAEDESRLLRLSKCITNGREYEKSNAGVSRKRIVRFIYDYHRKGKIHK